jgi:hypothetical protein
LLANRWEVLVIQRQGQCGFYQHRCEQRFIAVSLGVPSYPHPSPSFVTHPTSGGIQDQPPR